MKDSTEKIRLVIDGIFRLILGGIFIYAAWSKIQDPALFARAIMSYQMMPSIFIGPLALFLPMVEIIAGLALITSKWSRESTILILGMLGMFFIGLSQAWIRGLDISCGCFGGGEGGGGDSIGAALVRDTFLLIPAIWLICRPNTWFFNCRFAGGTLVILAAIGVWAIPSSKPTPSGSEIQQSDRGMFLAPRGIDTNQLESAETMIAEIAARATEKEISQIAIEQWTKNFPAALARARAEHRPLLMMEGARKCGYCKRLRQAVGGKVFTQWAKGTGLYFANALLDETNKVPTSAVLAEFLAVSPHEKALPGFPYVGVYWPKASNDFVWTVFSGRRGEMPGSANPSLALELTSALESILADHFKTRGKRLSNDDLVAASAKRIKAATKGSGKVVMTPADGELRDNGMRIELVAKPAKGYAFKEWRGPDGKRVRTEGPFPIPRLSLPFTSREGTYTAVFKKR